MVVEYNILYDSPPGVLRQSQENLRLNVTFEGKVCLRSYPRLNVNQQTCNRRFLPHACT